MGKRQQGPNLTKGTRDFQNKERAARKRLESPQGQRACEGFEAREGQGARDGQKPAKGREPEKGRKPAKGREAATGWKGRKRGREGQEARGGACEGRRKLEGQETSDALGARQTMIEPCELKQKNLSRCFLSSSRLHVFLLPQGPFEALHRAQLRPIAAGRESVL